MLYENLTELELDAAGPLHNYEDLLAAAIEAAEQPLPELTEMGNEGPQVWNLRDQKLIQMKGMQPGDFVVWGWADEYEDEYYILDDDLNFLKLFVTYG